MRNHRLTALVAVALLLGLGAVGCADSGGKKTAGQVVDKERKRNCTGGHSDTRYRHGGTRNRSRHALNVGCSTDYRLTVRDRKRERHTFTVGRGEYDLCAISERYPRCAQ